MTVASPASLLPRNHFRYFTRILQKLWLISVSYFPSMIPRSVRLLVALATAFVSLHVVAQVPRVYLKFDGTLADSSSAPVLTSINPSAGWTPTYGIDRNGAAGKALDISAGSRSLQLISSANFGNSNLALGLRNSIGTSTSFTLSAWIYCTNTSGGYNTVFGNLGSGAGTLHAGLGSNVAKTHFGFDGNDVNGALTDIAGGSTSVNQPGCWYHLAFVYDSSAQTQRIFINGIPEITRTGVTNNLKISDVLIGNWNTTTDASNDFRGRIDDVAIYASALTGPQIAWLYNGGDANTLPTGSFSSAKLPGFTNAAGKWGVREIKNYTAPTNSPGIGYGVLVNAERIARAPTTTSSGVQLDYLTPLINFADPENGGASNFDNTSAFGTDTPADDNSFMMIAKCAVRIPVESDYSFGFRSDDGARLRVLGQTFISSYAINGSAGNTAIPAHLGDSIQYTTGTGNSGTMGVVHLTPGDYNLEFLYWEGSGGSYAEVFAATGAKTSFDSTFQLIGNTAAGGLEIVRDPDTYPRIPAFTVAGGGSIFVHNGLPANATFAWQTNADSLPGTTVSISPTIGTVAASGSTTIPTPAQSTTYTITVSNAVETATKTVRIFVDEAPVINSFTANRTTVTTSAPVTLNWSVDGATTLTLDPGNINVTGQTSRVVNPATTTTYTLTASNVAGSVQLPLTITVGPPPVISSFTTSDANPLYGAQVTLAWSASNFDTLSIDQGLGAVFGASGSVTVAPLVTTTYTFTATNGFGSVTASVVVNQPTPIGVNASGFTVTRYNASTSLPFTGMGYLQSADALIAGTNLSGAPITATGVTSINYSEGADGEFTPGNTAFPGTAASGVNFALRVTGILNVNTPGEYTFVLNSDDGARLRVDGQDVIVDDATHGPSSNSGKVTITKAQVPIEIVYYNAPTNGGSAGAELEFAWIRPNLQWTLLGSVTPTPPVVLGQVMISEFVADNNKSLADEDGTFADWIEIWNSTNATVNLSGYYLTDDAATPNKWAFPTGPGWTLGPNKYLVVFASQKDRRPAQAVAGQDNPGTAAQPHLHTNFKLPKGGGYLALNKDNGSGGFAPVTVFAAYPPQLTDVSYGTSDAESYLGFMQTPTPGQPNTVSFAGFVSDTNFDHARGRYTAPFSLAITTATPGATIRYTTDGSTPTLTNGTTYTGPVPISATTAIRATAFKTGWKPTNVDTNTYIFTADVANQTSATAIALGFPSGSVNGQVFRYPVALANVVDAGGGKAKTFTDELAAMPTVCMSTDIGNLADPATGIYANPAKHGLFWERPASIEYLNAAGGSEFQIDCGTRVRGGYSRSTNNPKHAFHLFFRGSLYEGDLKYRLFGAAGADHFSQIDMRCEENYSWSFANDSKNLLVREEWSRLTQADMGQPYARTGYFHLFINGIYWGVYNWEERTEASFGETYLGGLKDNQDTVKSAGSPSYDTEMTDGNFAAWKSLFDQSVALKNDTTSEASRTARYLQMRGLNPDGTRNLAYPVLLDVDNLIDYLLVIFYDGSFDAPLSTFLNNASNNWFGVRDRAGQKGFTYYAHDNEHGFDSNGATNSYNRVGPWGDTGTNNWGQVEYNTRTTFSKSNPQYLHEFLCYSAEYRLRFADRLQKHLFNNGALTTVKATARFNALADQVATIIDAEAARWGSTSLNRNSWLTARAGGITFMNTGGNVAANHPAMQGGDRTNLLLQFFRSYTDNGAKPLYPVTTTASSIPLPAFNAPIFTGNFGGPVAKPYSFTIGNSNGAGTIYYTTDGTDPRAIGGATPSGTAISAQSPASVTLTQPATVRARIYNGALPTPWSAMTEANFLVGSAPSATTLVVSQIHYNPAGATNLTQFIEVMNIGAIPLDLTNVRFTLGITFTFPSGYMLAPGARAVIVRDQAAFAAAYGSSVPVVGVFPSGTFLGLSGARLQITNASNTIIRDFTYATTAPWPTSPNDGGPSLMLIRPETNPNPASGANWRASSLAGGNPNSTDSFRYSAWAAANNITDPAGDNDRDGISNFLEYALGTDPNDPASADRPTFGTQAIDVGGTVSDYLTITFPRASNRDDATYSAEATADVTTAWSPAVLVGSPTFNGDGTETLTYRYPQPKSTDASQFLRLRITTAP